MKFYVCVYVSPTKCDCYHNINIRICVCAGIRPRASDMLIINPLVPGSWDYFCIDHLKYRGRYLTVMWDPTGSRYGQEAGLSVLVNGHLVANARTIQRLRITLP